MALTRRGWLTLGAGSTLVVGVSFAAFLLPPRSEDPSGDSQQDRLELRAPESVVITAEAEGTIAPGVTVPLNLAFDNPNDFPLALEEIHVAVTGIDAPRARAERPCTSADYTVRQLSTDTLLMIAADSVTELRDLDLATDQLPAVTLADRPVNQDGCKGATVTLTYETVGLEVP